MRKYKLLRLLYLISRPCVFGFMLLIVFVSFNSNVFAEDYSISMTTSGTVDISVRAGSTSIENDDIRVMTTCRAGYNLLLSTSVNDNNSK